MTRPEAPSLDRSNPPRSGPVRSFGFPDVAAASLPNGLEMRVAPVSRVPLVTLLVVLDAGESILPRETAGLAALTGQGLDGGTGKRTGPELAEAFEDIGAGLAVNTGWDATTLSVTCLADRGKEALDLLAETLLLPEFPDSEIDRLRNQRLAAIRQRRMDPGSLADDAASRFLFSDASPFHRPLRGTEDSVAALGRDQILDFVDRQYRPSGSGLIVVGDVDPSEVEGLATPALGRWTGGREERGEVKSEARFQERRVVVVDRPGAVQSEIRIGQVGASRSTPHFFPLKVFNTILGGAFTSRLMLSLREVHGFTYGVRSRFALRRVAGPFTISMAVATEVTGSAVNETFIQLERLLNDGPEEIEVERARDYIAGIFPLHLETTGQVAARIAELQIHDLPQDFFATYRERIRQVAPQGALEAGRRLIRLQELVVVVVGDAQVIRTPLEDLALGPVDVVTEI